MAPGVPFPVGFKEELEKRSTVHIKKSQASKNPTPVQTLIPVDTLADFTKHLQSSERILALFGAGLSAPSGLATFRGSQDIFRGYDPPMLSTLRRFEEDPILSWWFYSSRRSKSLAAKPNDAHFALARLGSVKEDFLAITQNIDGMKYWVDELKL
jgi:NAD-dependent deacetylase sirtuin 5